MNGILNINKPKGISSNAVLTKIKKRFNIKKIGHLGTLDPMAEGVLPITIGKATRLFDLFLKKDKTYFATFTFGIETDTLDSEGKITKQNSALVKKEEIEKVLQEFTGNIMQVPPKFSAKNVNGKRAYQLARNEEEFTLSPKEVTIYNIELKEEIEKNTFTFFIHCSSGTYIRSIVRDIANKLNTVGYMSALTRLSSGNFKLESSVNLNTLLENDINDYFIPLEKVLKDYKKVELAEECYFDLLNGKKIPFNKEENDFLLYCKNELFGIATSNDGYIKIKTYLKS